MDIAKIQEFENYQLIFDEDPKFLLDQILAQATYLSPAQKKIIYTTYAFAQLHHKDIKRHSGEPYIVHPLRVLEFLMDVKPDLPSIQTALLHDIIEDTEVTFEDIKKEFGEEVATLCDGLVKVSKVRYRGEERQIETLKKTFLAMAKDLRVIIIKMADRVHNIQTLHFHPKKEKRVRIAEETLKIYVPIAKRLGLYVYQGYLENGAFKNLDTREYTRIRNYILKQYGNVEGFKQEGIATLTRLCDEEGLAYCEIKWRIKSPFRIYKKLIKYQTQDISKVMDVIAFRVLTKEVGDCYNMLWIIHKHYTPIFSKMKDYIAIPKPNGYKSLHTTVLGMFDFPVEIQVRTQDMDRVADYGVAAHFIYSDDQAFTMSEKQEQWIKSLQDIVQRYSAEGDKEKFKDALQIEIFEKDIFVYTPKGDIIELPAESTVLDFAFRVHSEVGLKFRNAFINGRIVPIDYMLKTGNIIDIKTYKNKYTATRGWLNYLHTPSAKTKLNKFLRQQEKNELFNEMKPIINQKLSEYKLPLLGAKDDQITKLHKDVAFEHLLHRLRDKQISVTKLIKDTYPHIALLHPEHPLNEGERQNEAINTGISQTLNQAILIDEDKEVNYELCPECCPHPPQKLIAKSDKHGIKVHALTCEALQTINYSKLMEAHRWDQAPNKYKLKMQVQALDKPWVLLDILKIFEFFGINVTDIHSQHTDTWYALVMLELSFVHPAKMYYLLNDLKMRKDLLKVVSQEII